MASSDQTTLPEEEAYGDEAAHVNSEAFYHQLVDFRGKPLTSQTSSRLGGWRAAMLFLGAIAAADVGFAGIFLNLVLYLTNVWGLANAEAANNVTNVTGTMFFFAVVGAFLSDAYLGRYWGCTIFLTVYFVGCAAFSAFVAVTGMTTWQWLCLNTSLYMAAIGYGAFQPAFSALGGDQLDTAEEKGTFFNFFFVLSNVGQGVALVVLSSLEYAAMWALGFSVGAGMAGVGLLFFLSGTTSFRLYRAGGNPLSRIAQVLVAATCRAHLQFPAAAAGNDYMGLLYKPTSSMQNGELCHTDRFRWLDKAALKDGGPGTKWHICTMSQVEEVKCLLSVLPIFMIGVVYNVTVAQLSTVFSEQGTVMGQPHWITIPPTSMQVFNIAANIVFGMVYDVVVTRLGQSKVVTKLQRIGVGLLMAMASMMVAAAIESTRLFFHTHGVDISIFWLVPQYVLVGISQVLMVVAQMEFFYSEVSRGMRSLGLCLPLLERAFGNYLSTFIVDIVTSVTTRNGNPGWIAEDFNHGHLDYFYWTIAVIIMVDFLIFLGFAKSYKYLDLSDEKESCDGSGLTPPRQSLVGRS